MLRMDVIIVNHRRFAAARPRLRHARVGSGGVGMSRFARHSRRHVRRASWVRKAVQTVRFACRLTTRGAALGKARFPAMLVSYRPLASSWPGGNDPAPPRGCAIESALPIELVGEESLTWYCRKVISTGATCEVPPRDDKLIDTLRKAASRRDESARRRGGRRGGSNNKTNNHYRTHHS